MHPGGPGVAQPGPVLSSHKYGNKVPAGLQFSFSAWATGPASFRLLAAFIFLCVPRTAAVVFAVGTLASALSSLTVSSQHSS